MSALRAYLVVGLTTAACSVGPTSGVEATRAKGGPEGLILRSADGNFEVIFEPGALSRRTEGIIRQHSDLTPSAALSPDLPAYELSLVDCVISRPELVRMRHRVPEAYADRIWLTLAEVGERDLLPFWHAVRADGWVEGWPSFWCENQGLLRRSFTLVCSRPPGALCPNHVCAPPSPPGMTAFCPNEPLALQGWEAPVGSGQVYAVSDMQIAESERGLDLRTECGPRENVLPMNVLAPLAELRANIPHSGLPPSETIIFEREVLRPGYEWIAPCPTLRAYRALDADDPFYPANDFTTPPGSESCCEFLVRYSSVSGIPLGSRFRADIGPRGTGFESEPFAELPIPIEALVGALSSFSPFEWPKLERARVVLPELDLADRWVDARLGGALSAHELSRQPHPSCLTAHPRCPPEHRSTASLLDLVLTFAQPDVDLDDPPDGLERLELGADGRVARCVDGDGTEVPPTGPGAAWTCVEDPRMRDGFSVAFELQAVPATVLGFRD